MTTQERFWGKVLVSENRLDCWPWLAGKTQGGYGRFKAGGKKHVAHRYAYEQVNGIVPSGLQLDHLCRNRECCNPSHMEPVSQRENIVRGVGPTAVNAAKDRCNSGHPFDQENTRSYKGERHCRACQRVWAKRHRDKVSNGR